MSLKNKDGSGNWPNKSHIGWTVLVAGNIELYKEYLTISSRQHEGKILPRSLGVILKAIDNGEAWVYHFNYGVMKLPVELLVAWDR